MGLARPSEVAPPVREAGGDNEVPRDSNGRPRIIVPCPAECNEGRVPSEKKPPPATVKCPKGCGPTTKDPWIPVGKKAVAYTRTTTFIDVIEDKSNLQAWGERMVLIGVNRDQRFLEDVEWLHEQATAAFRDCRHTVRDRKDMERGDCECCDAKAAKDELNRRAQAAKIKAGSEEKADKGTHLHGLSELEDLKQDLPVLTSFEDVVDMDSYRRATTWLKIVHMEQLVVHDEFQIGGTPDRVSELRIEEFKENFSEMFEEHGGLVAPDGSVILPGELIITDLKTGSVEYGGLKMAMQLSIYSRSDLYDKETGERTSMGPVNQKWGIIMHLAAGTGECVLYWADLTLGWEAVEVAKQVRGLRSKSRTALRVLTTTAPSQSAAA